MADLTALLKDIMSGEYDGDLVGISDAIKWRRDITSQVNALSLKPGDRVRFVGNVNPSYLRGVEATIKSKRTKKFVVTVDPVGRFRSGNIVVDPSLIEKV